MARRKDHSPDELKSMILDAAETAVATHGLGALSARKLAAAIGYTPGTLYNHFDDLDEIILALNARTLRKLADVIGQAVEAAASPSEGLQAGARAYAAFASQSVGLWSALTEFRRSKPGAPPAWYVSELQQVFVRVVDMLRPVWPGLPDDELAYRARALWAAIHGICTIAGAGSIGQMLVTPHDQMIDDVVQLFLQWPEAA
ncbi:MAG: TetR/AcrR family transcriptional regulator [Pseudomonadota bacterium]